MRPESKPKPVNNIAKLEKPMWKRVASRPENRCLIPLTGFAEAEGPKGAKTRTWFSLRDQPVFAWAGLWRASDEWGPVYSGLMTDANAAIAPVHDRMPVLLPEDYDRWMLGDFEDALAFQQRRLPDAPIEVNRISDMWDARKNSRRVRRHYCRLKIEVPMANELDDIRATADCPACGKDFSASYKTMRLGLTIECPHCGETIKPIDDTAIGKIQKLIDEAGKP